MSADYKRALAIIANQILDFSESHRCKPDLIVDFVKAVVASRYLEPTPLWRSLDALMKDVTIETRGDATLFVADLAIALRREVRAQWERDYSTDHDIEPRKVK